jgi:hypothetical protein
MLDYVVLIVEHFLKMLNPVFFQCYMRLKVYKNKIILIANTDHLQKRKYENKKTFRFFGVPVQPNPSLIINHKNLEKGHTNIKWSADSSSLHNLHSSSPFHCFRCLNPLMV